MTPYETPLQSIELRRASHPVEGRASSRLRRVSHPGGGTLEGHPVEGRASHPVEGRAPSRLCRVSHPGGGSLEGHPGGGIPKGIAVLLLDRDGRRVRDRMTGLARSGHVEAAESAESAEAWLPRADDVQPDVILISADTFSEQEVEEATAMLEPVHPESRVVLVDVPAGDEAAPRPAALGAWGRLKQGAPFAELAEAICRVAGGQAIISGERLGRLMLHLQQQVRLGPSVPTGTTGLARARLTAREREVLGLMADRLTNREIAVALNLELGTVKNHVHSVLKKLSLQNRQQAVYFRSGVVALPWRRT